MDSSLILIAIVVAVALAFDFTNGFHDTANAMATTVATGAMPPRVAVIVAGVLNFVGAFLSLKVAATIASGIVSSELTTPAIVFAGLVGAIGWNLITWYFGIPSSSSHALIGGVIGATVAAVGFSGVNGSGIVSKVLIPAIFSPPVACAVAAASSYLAYRTVRRVTDEQASRDYRWGQIGSASLVALAHGTNDAQKTMGVIVLALIGGGYLSGSGSDIEVPLWVIVCAATAIGVGTAVGGWRIIRTLGNRLTDIAPPQGFGAETSCAAVILSSAAVGFPLSTTHVVAGGVVGSGLGRFKSFSSINWGVFSTMVIAWVFTLPGAALIAGVAGLATGALGSTAGVVIVSVVAAAGGVGIWLAAQRDPVTPDNVNEVSPAKAALATGGGAV